MSDWAAKRFWKRATALEVEGGFAVQLDSRMLKTPFKSALHLPTLPMAEAIATEWDAQADIIDPNTMPVTRAANSAIDKITPQRDEVIALLAEYAQSDLLCYRAHEPAGLVARQAEGWDPLLEWSADRLNARLNIGQGITHVPQDEAVVARLASELDDLDNFALVAAHDLISLSGSFVIAFAVINEAIPVYHAWAVSRIDEHWQAEQWGADEEAAAAEAAKLLAFENAARFYQLSLR